MFRSRILGRLFGPKRIENKKFRNVHSGKFYSLYCSLNKIRAIKSKRLRCTGHIAKMEEGTSAFKILTGKPNGKGLLRKLRRE